MNKEIIIVSRNIEITPSLKEYLEIKLGKIKKFNPYINSITAEIKVEKHDGAKKQGISIVVEGKDKTFHKEIFEEDLYQSIDEASDNLVRQIRKEKERKEFKHRHNARKVVTSKENKNISDKIVKIKRFEMKPMFAEEAYLQMKQLGHMFFLFFDAGEEKIQVIRKTKQDKGFEMVELNELNPISEADAIYLIEELDYDFVSYFDIDLDKPRILYKRKDGKYAVIEPIDYN